MTDRDLPIRLSFDEAADEYEATNGFFNEAVDHLLSLPADTPIPLELRQQVVAWFRTQDIYVQAVQNVQDEAAR
jgi:hypothetical protein